MVMKLKYRELLRQPRVRNGSSRTIFWHCIACGKEVKNALVSRCPSCNGPVDAIYPNSSHSDSSETSPLRRYMHLLPIADETNIVELGEGNTPCIHATRLGKLLGLENLYLKDETKNPSMSTKDRIASVGLSFYKEHGVREFVVTSTGNSSTAYARGVQLTPGFMLHVFVGNEFLQRLNYPDHPDVANYVVNAPFVEAGIAAKRFAGENGILEEPGFFSVARREGLKLAYLEAYDEMPEAPAFVFQAISSGMGLLGAYKGAIEYSHLGRLQSLPRFMAVQQSTCAPMVAAFEEDASQIRANHIIKHPQGIAEAILRGDPTQTYPYIRSIAIESGGRIMRVNNEEIGEAQTKLFEYEGVEACPSAAAAVAAMIQLSKQGQIDSQDPILVSITGGIRPTNVIPSNVIQYGVPVDSHRVAM